MTTEAWNDHFTDYFKNNNSVYALDILQRQCFQHFPSAYFVMKKSYLLRLRKIYWRLKLVLVPKLSNVWLLDTYGWDAQREYINMNREIKNA
jgi:hypothetical protein